MRTSKITSNTVKALLVAGIYFFTAAVMAKPIGKIALAIGKVQVKEKGGQWKKATPGMFVTDKTEINTGFRSKAIVQLKTGSRLMIKQSTMMSFAKFSKGPYGTATDVNLRLGGVTAMVAKIKSKDKRNYFRVRTPTAVAGVRGTIEEVNFFPDTGTTVNLLESSAQIMNRMGIRSDIPQGGTAAAGPQGQMIFPDEFANMGASVFLDDPSMSAGEREFLLDAFDPMFGGSAADLEFLNDLLFEEFGFFEVEIVEFEKL